MAHHVIQGHLHQEHAKQQGIECNLSQVVELTIAQCQSKNSLGAIMSMRKYHKLLSASNVISICLATIGYGYFESVEACQLLHE
jgi:hypothetical protein